MNSTFTSNSAAASTQVGNMQLHVPFPQELGIECEKAKEIILEFSKTFSSHNVDIQTIPPQAFVAAKGVVIISVLKIGAGWSGKIGSGLIVAKLPDGRWSAPSSVALIGAGYGPQIGASITDFIYVLNTDDSIKTFSQDGQITLGAQFSMTAGSSGKAMEATTILSKGVSPVGNAYCYAKSKGLFIGVSLEGAVISSRRDANERFYHEKNLTPAQLLTSAMEPAAAAEPLYDALNLASALALSSLNEAVSQSNTIVNQTPSPQTYVQPQTTLPSAPKFEQQSTSQSSSLYPEIPILPERAYEPIAVALYDYEAQRPTDLSFKRGDVITIVSRSEIINDWWVGRLNGKEGRFPANRTKVEN
ncbi:hypothetical protein HK096_009651 [Nowakowskiella sp. JEL0078]|nr:hypothetical protein HK096_009651 [Nowakowskiella sp. JEL0078]